MTDRIITVQSPADYAPFMQGDDLFVREIMIGVPGTAVVTVPGNIHYYPSNADLPVLHCADAFILPEGPANA